MHIGMILYSKHTFPPDIRVEKEARALAEAGFKVTVLTDRVTAEEASLEQIKPNFWVKRTFFPESPHLLGKMLSHLTLVRKEFLRVISDFIKNQSPDVLHVHDFNLVPTVLKLAHEYNLPVIADLHENMPAALVALRAEYPQPMKLINQVILNYHLWRWHESRTLPLCKRVVVVVPEAVPRLFQYKIPKSDIVVVSNTEDDHTFSVDEHAIDQYIINKYKYLWMAAYVGGIGPHRGVNTVLHALPHIKGKIPDFIFAVIGARRNDADRILKEARRLEVSQMVEVVSWQPFEKVSSYIQASKVCLVPHNNFEHTQTTVPHKLFQYMISKRAVLVSDCRPLARIVDDAQAGLVYRADDPRDLSEKLVFMASHSRKRHRMGLNGQRAALGKYAWRHDSRRLIRMYSDLESELKLGLTTEESGGIK
jgi:glycosyltransferase involved in cell wall biosynthesis